MLIACWSAKGGTGTTVVAAALGVLLARSSGAAVVADLAGDVPAVLGLDDRGVPGIAEWLTLGDNAPAGGLALLELPAAQGLTVLPRGSGPLGPPQRAELLAALLSSEPRQVVADCGVLAPGVGTDSGDVPLLVASSASVSLLVIRPCYLAVRRALDAPLRPSGIVLLAEPNRSLTAGDIEDALGVPIRAEVAVDPAIARAVDAGTLLHRVPRALVRGLRAAA
jgi:hypothetical protein